MNSKNHLIMFCMVVAMVSFTIASPLRADKKPQEDTIFGANNGHMGEHNSGSIYIQPNVTAKTAKTFCCKILKSTSHFLLCQVTELSNCLSGGLSFGGNVNNTDKKPKEVTSFGANNGNIGSHNAEGLSFGGKVYNVDWGKTNGRLGSNPWYYGESAGQKPQQVTSFGANNGNMGGHNSGGLSFGGNVDNAGNTNRRYRYHFGESADRKPQQVTSFGASNGNMGGHNSGGLSFGGNVNNAGNSKRRYRYHFGERADQKSQEDTSFGTNNGNMGGHNSGGLSFGGNVGNAGNSNSRYGHYRGDSAALKRLFKL